MDQQPARDAALGVNAAASAAGAIALLAARRHRLVPAATATAAQMTLLLVYWELMARYFDRHQQSVSSSDPGSGGCPLCGM